MAKRTFFRIILTVAVCAAAAATLFFRSPTYFAPSYISIVEPLRLQGNRPSGLLMDGEVLEQEITLSSAEQKNLEALETVCVRPMLGTYGRKNSGALHVTFEAPWWTVAGDMDVAHLRDNSLATICAPVKPRTSVEDRQFLLRIEAKQGGPKTSVSAWMTAEAGKGRATLNGVDQNMGLVFSLAKPDEHTFARIMRKNVLLAIFLLTIGVLAWTALRPRSDETR